jgi:hypothetical protein
VFSDPRYIKVNGKPFFIVYRPSLIPDLRQTLRTWRNEAQKLGIGELYLGYSQGFQLKEDPVKLGFDVAIDFQPDFYNTPPAYHGTRFERLLHKLKIRSSIYKLNQVIDYPEYVKNAKRLPRPEYKQFPCITPMWDNTARRKKGAFIFRNADPKTYEGWLRHIKQNFRPYSDDENFIFINAWNEWAEGNHLEPCIKWGRAYLEATKRSFKDE